MNYYPFHLGDYAAHTGHLEPMEDLAYRRLLDQYYLREGSLPADVQVTAKLVRMRSMAADVESVLNEFFTLTELGWSHSRCDLEIEKMQDKQAKARASGVASANARKAYVERARQAKPTDVEEKSTDVERSLVESLTDVQLPTPTPTPTPTPIEEKRESACALRSAPTPETPVLEKQADPAKPAKPQATAKPDDVDDQTWADWLALRKAKRAPVSATVIDGARAEAGKAGLSLEAFLRVWCTRGSQGLMAEWLKPNERSGANRIQSFAQQDAAEKRARWEAMTGRKWPSADDVPEFIEAGKPTQKTVQRIAA